MNIKGIINLEYLDSHKTYIEDISISDYDLFENIEILSGKNTCISIIIKKNDYIVFDDTFSGKLYFLHEYLFDENSDETNQFAYAIDNKLTIGEASLLDILSDNEGNYVELSIQLN